jgi:hypothetical protein
MQTMHLAASLDVQGSLEITVPYDYSKILFKFSKPVLSSLAHH